MSEFDLFNAVGKNQYYRVKYMLEHEINPNGTFGEYCSTPLMNIDSDNINMAKLLIKHGAMINTEGSSGLTALLISASCGYIRVFNYLIKKGANYNHRNVDGWTCAHFAARNNYLHILRSLTACGADLSQTNNQGATPYDIAVLHRNKEAQGIILGIKK